MLSNQRSYWGVIVLGLVVLVLAGLAVMPVASVTAQSDGPKVIKSNSVAYGRTYSEWSAAWWQWAFSIPVASHPLFDNGDCSIGQSGPVWFLGGKFCQNGQSCPSTVVRSCSVPAGKAIYFPVVNIEDSAPEEPNWGCGNNMPPLASGTIAEMRQCTAPYIDGTYNLSVVVDGQPLHAVKENFRVQSVQFDVTMPDDNFLTAIGEGPFSGGYYSPVIDDGVYVLLSPLAPGAHTLHFQGTWPWGSTLDITYKLSVK